MNTPSHRPPLSLLVAMSENHVIGRDGGLPWHLSADLKRFKALTMGHHLIMGRKTFDSIGRLLPGRTTVIVTRDPNYAVAGALVVHDLPQAYHAARHDTEAFVVGGGEIYRQALDAVDRIYLTRVHAEVAGDTVFPELPDQAWRVVTSEHFAADDRNDFAHTFQVLERAGRPQMPPTH